MASETIPGNPHGGPFAVFAVFKSTETTGHQEHVMLVPLEEHVMTYIPFGFRLRTEHTTCGVPGVSIVTSGVRLQWCDHGHQLSFCIAWRAKAWRSALSLRVPVSQGSKPQSTPEVQVQAQQRLGPFCQNGVKYQFPTEGAAHVRRSATLFATLSATGRSFAALGEPKTWPTNYTANIV